MVKYTRLTFMEREEISRQLATNLSIRSIAKNLKRSAGSISREIKRSCMQRAHYRAFVGQNYAYEQLHKISVNRKLDRNPKLRDFVIHFATKECWSPEQIAKRLKILYPNDMNMQISHESIYSYLYVYPRTFLKKEIVRSLRRAHLQRRTRKPRQKPRGAIQDFLCIEQRPPEIANRFIPGHWEGDMVIGSNNKSAIGTLVERTTRLTLLVKLQNQDATTVRKAFAKEFRRLPEGLRQTLTYDRGKEMAHHKLFTKDTNITVYFAHPHSPWERGTNENTNSLVRQFYPKDTDFSKVSEKKLKLVQEKLNNRPRKVHKFYTPNEVFHKLLQ